MSVSNSSGNVSLRLCLRLCLYTSVFTRLNSLRQRDRNSLKANKVTSSTKAVAASVDGRLPTDNVSSDETIRVVLCISVYHVATASDTKTAHKTAQYSCTFYCQHGCRGTSRRPGPLGPGNHHRRSWPYHLRLDLGMTFGQSY